MIITVTERGTFRRCRRRWDYSSRRRQSLEPIVDAPALTLGSLAHASLEYWLNNPGADVGDLTTAYLTDAAAKIATVKQEYHQAVGANISESELTPVYEQLELGLEMVRNYQVQWGTPLPEGFILLQPEQQCIVDIPNTWHWECDTCGHVPTYATDQDGYPRYCNKGHAEQFMRWQLGQLEATFDSLLVDVFNRGWIRECKTYKTRPRKDALKSNDQFLAYIWVLEQLHIFDEVGGVLYDGLWKRRLPQPRTLKNGQPSKARMKYELEDLFHREMIVRPREEIDEFERHLAYEFLDMLQPNIYPNRRWEGCFDCRFEMLCTAESRGEDFDYIKSTYYKRRDDWRGLREDDWWPDDSEGVELQESGGGSLPDTVRPGR